MLQVPITWETQVSLLGNKASTWEMLIDKRKLPFMAMLRNLRNVIQAKISPDHHTKIIKNLMNYHAVVGSRQFPFQFFSAYDVLSKLTPEAADLKKDQLNLLVNRYRGALDTAVKIATRHNVSPIRGQTVILCDVDDTMRQPCAAARGLGSRRNKQREVLEVALLTSLMCQYACEDCSLNLYSDCLPRHEVTRPQTQLKSTILKQIDGLLKLISEHSKTVCRVCASPKSDDWASMSEDARCDAGCRYASPRKAAGFPLAHLANVMLRDTAAVDTLVILSDKDGPPSGVANLVAKYRRLVNPKMLFVTINPGSKTTSIGGGTTGNPNDIAIAGFSDAILRFIADRNDSANLLAAVNTIDQAYQLDDILAALAPCTPVTGALAGTSEAGTTGLASVMLEETACAHVRHQRTARVFISSTFRDMHGERDLLTRFVVPEVRARAEKHGIAVAEVDLRWGVTEAAVQNNEMLPLCMDEIDQSNFFVGMVGERYGWVPEEYATPNEPRFDWLKNHPAGHSITSLEMEYAMKKESEGDIDCIFALRSNEFGVQIPKEHREDFVDAHPQASQRLANFRCWIQERSECVLDGYPAAWHGVVDGKPMASGLEELGRFFVEKLWKAILSRFEDDQQPEEKDAASFNAHRSYLVAKASEFIGHKTLVDFSERELVNNPRPIMYMTGPSGTGKTSLVAAICQRAQCKDPRLFIAAHFVGCTNDSTKLHAVLLGLCQQLDRAFVLPGTVSETASVTELQQQLADSLAAAVKQTQGRLLLAVDGVDQLDKADQAQTLGWVPKHIDPRVSFLFSTAGGVSLETLQANRQAAEVEAPPLSLHDRSEFVRRRLAPFRKTLDESPFNNQLKLLVTKKEGGNPLFLILACEELRLSGVFEQMTEKIKRMSGTVVRLVEEVLKRLETDVGTNLVSCAFQLLVCARSGLREMDIKHITSRSFPKEATPLKLAHLWRSLMPFLLLCDASTGAMSLSNQVLKHVVTKQYLQTRQATVLAHTALATHYSSAANNSMCVASDEGGGEPDWAQCDDQALTELTHHLVHGQQWQTLRAVLTSLRFVAAKCFRGLTASLAKDYLPREFPDSQQISQKECSKIIEEPAVVDFARFVNSSMHILGADPALALQQAMNEPESSHVETAARTALLDDAGTLQNVPATVSWTNKPAYHSPCKKTVSGFGSDIASVGVSRDSLIIACGCVDGLIYLYSAGSFELRGTLQGHCGSITALCFVDQRQLCSAAGDGEVKLWEVDSGSLISSKKDHQRKVSSLSTDQAGEMIATASWDCGVRLYRTKQGLEEHAFLRGPSSPANAVSLHPEALTVAVGYWDSTIKVFDVFTQKEVATLTGHTKSVRDLAYSPDGRYIVSASSDGTLRLWSAAAAVAIGMYIGHSGPVNKLTFSPLGNEFVTAADDCTAKVWHSRLGKELWSVPPPDRGAATCMQLSPDNELVVIGYVSGHVLVYSTDGDVVATLESPNKIAVNSVCFAEQDTIIIGMYNGDIAEFSLLAGTSADEPTAPNTHFPAHRGMVHAIATSKRQQFVATGAADTVIRIFNKRSVSAHSSQPSKDLREWERASTDDGREKGWPVVTLNAHTQAVTALAFLESALPRLVSAGHDGAVMVWQQSCSWQQWEATHTVLGAHKDWINALQVCCGGTRLVTASNDYSLKVWELPPAAATTVSLPEADVSGDGSSKDAEQEATAVVTTDDSADTILVLSQTFTGHESAVTGLGVVDDADVIVSSSMDGTARAWSLKAGVEITALGGGGAALHHICAVNDGSGNMFIADDDGVVRMFAAFRGEATDTLIGHSSRLADATFTPSGDLVTCGRDDRSIRVWSVARQGISLPTHDAGSLAVAKDGAFFLVGDGCGTVTLRRLPNSSDSKHVSDAETAEVGGAGAIISSSILHEHAVSALEIIAEGCGTGKTDKDECWFASASHDASVAVWHYTNDTFTQLDTLSLSSPISALTYSQSEHCLAAGCWDGSVHLIYVSKMMVLGKPKEVGRSNAGGVSVVCSSDPRSLVLSGDEVRFDWVSRLEFTGMSQELTATFLNGLQWKLSPFQGAAQQRSATHILGVRLASAACDASGTRLPYSAQAETKKEIMRELTDTCWLSASLLVRLPTGATAELYSVKSGQLILEGTTDERSSTICQAHTEDIVAIQQLASSSKIGLAAEGLAAAVVATASKDCHVKVWAVNAAGGITQIGKFTCLAPCSALVAHGDVVCVSDRLGNVYVLKLGHLNGGLLEQCLAQ